MNIHTRRLALLCILAAAFAAALASSPAAHAQKPGKGHELRLGVSGFPIGPLLCGGNGLMKYDAFDVMPVFGGSSVDRYNDYYGDLKSAGTWMLQYSYNFNDRNAVGMNLGCDLLFGSLHDGYTGERKGGSKAYGILFYPEYRRTWNPMNRLKAYCAISIGIGLGSYHDMDGYPERRYVRSTGTWEYSDRWSYVPLFEFTPLGLTYGGDNLFGFAQLSVGTVAFGGRIGIGYKF
ncbi:MAG: hypothetical protein KBS78_04005 [Bacteroidales bacterium]|nr:hypothetical protein [Candidatus Cryptobacteroides faecihippi]